MLNKKLLIIGSTCVDVIIKLDHLPVTGEDMHPEWQHFAMGGCAYNVSQVPYGCGLDVTLLTPVGTLGVYSGFVRTNLLNQGIKGPVTVEGAGNGCCYCFVEKDGERTFVSLHGVEYSFNESYTEKLKNHSFEYTYICGLEVEEETGYELIEWLENHVNRVSSVSDGIDAGTLVYAPGPRGVNISPDKNERIFALKPVLHLNEDEAIALSGENTPEAAASRLQKQTGNLIVITMGEKGVLWMEKDGSLHRMPSRKVTVKDTIGAGDSHCGAVIAGLSMEWNMEKTMSFAGFISGEVVSREGAVLPSKDIKNIFDDLSSHID